MLAHGLSAKLNQQRYEPVKLTFEVGKRLVCFTKISFLPDFLQFEHRFNGSIGMEPPKHPLERMRRFTQLVAVAPANRIADF